MLFYFRKSVVCMESESGLVAALKKYFGSDTPGKYVECTIGRFRTKIYEYS